MKRLGAMGQHLLVSRTLPHVLKLARLCPYGAERQRMFYVFDLGTHLDIWEANEAEPIGHWLCGPTLEDIVAGPFRTTRSCDDYIAGYIECERKFAERASQ